MTSKYATLSADEKARARIGFAIAAQDANGSAIYNAEKALVGYVEGNKFLILPKEFHEKAVAAKWDPISLVSLGEIGAIDKYTGPSGEDYRKENKYFTMNKDYTVAVECDLMFWKIATMNYMFLSNTEMNKETRFVASMLRARYCLIGAYHISSNDGLDKYNEVILVDSNTTAVSPNIVAIMEANSHDEIMEAMGDHVVDFLGVLNGDKCNSEWIVNHADNIWAAVEHVFRVRSHHFKTGAGDNASYKAMYSKYLKACYEGNFDWPEEVDMFSIFHTAVHPFKIKALPVLTAHMAAHSTIAFAALIRFEGSPCGHARITTTEAAMDTLRGEMWYSSFEKAYKNELELLSAAANEINNNKYSYHMGATLYGVNKLNSIKHKGTDVLLVKIESITSNISAAGQGLIQALASAKESNLINEYSLENAKALSKAGANNPLMTLKIAEVVMKSIEQVTTAKNMSDAISSALPPINAKTSNNVTATN